MWKTIPFAPAWQCSNTSGRISHKITKRIVSQQLTPKGYLQCKIDKTRRVNRIIAITWIPNQHNLPEAHHRNFIKTDNRAKNLKWVTSEQNREYSKGHQKWYSGFKNPLSIVSENMYFEIAELYAMGMRSRFIGEFMGVRSRIIRRVLQKQILPNWNKYKP